MLVKRPKPKKGTYRQTKQRILEHAAELFRKQGYYGTTMDEIAYSLNISKVMIYRYWDSKEDILNETVRIVHKDLISSLREITKSHDTPDEKLRRAIANHAAVFYHAILPVFGGIISPETLITKQHRHAIIKLRDEYDCLLREIIEEGMEQGIFIKCNPKFISFAMLGAANYIRTWYSHDGEFSFENVVGYIADYLTNGILTKEYRKARLPELK